MYLLQVWFKLSDAGAEEAVYDRRESYGNMRRRKFTSIHTTFVLVNCVAIFVTCQYLNERLSMKKIEKPIISFGGCTFGIYLLHIYIKDHTSLSWHIWITSGKKMQQFPMLYAFVYCGIIFMSGYLVTVILKKSHSSSDWFHKKKYCQIIYSQQKRFLKQIIKRNQREI